MPRIFEFLRTQKPGAGGEIQLTDAIQALLREEQVLAFRYHGQRFDCGSKAGYLKATVEFALRHPEVKTEFEAYLRERFGAAAPAVAAAALAAAKPEEAVVADGAGDAAVEA
jgi:UTP--glucose-1-phosphate uridylyltransferase